ncbi:MAG: response regulator transcription factor [Acidobacteriota bacterium]|nr:MAG: response regulator transcription factor [Acidobacteriota bacterium]
MNNNKTGIYDSLTKVLIVDDEPPARKRIRELLESRRGFEIVAECATGKSAVSAIEEYEPDLVFLDIRLGDLNAFEVINALDVQRTPLIVFVTAYDEFAVRAFDHHALDYLLKPFDDERFDETLTLAAERIRSDSLRSLDERLSGLFRDLEASQHPDSARDAPGRLVIRSAGKVSFVRISDIEWIEADGYYVSIRAAGKSHLMRESLKNLESKLDPTRFLRIHRSTIVNADRIKELHPHFHGEYYVELESGKRFKLSRSYRENAERILEGRF